MFLDTSNSNTPNFDWFKNFEHILLNGSIDTVNTEVDQNENLTSEDISNTLKKTETFRRILYYVTVSKKRKNFLLCIMGYHFNIFRWTWSKRGGKIKVQNFLRRIGFEIINTFQFYYFYFTLIDFTKTTKRSLNLLP